MRASTLLLVAACLLAGVGAVRADTPANCSKSEYIGTWTYSVGSVDPRGPATDCSNWDCSRDRCETYSLKLDQPNIAVDQNGNRGNWTLIYNQGVEVWIGGKIWFAFSDWTSTESLCHQTKNGWVHAMDNTQWSCFVAHRDGGARKQIPTTRDDGLTNEAGRLFDDAIANDPRRLNRKFRPSQMFVDAINKAQDYFTASYESALAAAGSGTTIGEVERRSGHKLMSGMRAADAFKSVLPKETATKNKIKIMLQDDAPASRLYDDHVSDLPESFDWRNVDGVNYVSPVRNQAQCGSCYAYSALGMMESRFRIASNNTLQPTLSTQDIVSCSNYSQGCEGGFPYLVAGKYGRDYGFIDEACYPYEGRDTECRPFVNPQPGCTHRRYRTSSYYYVGGYYGLSNEERMKQEIMANGPISVSFEVYDDFKYYRGGVYTHQFTKYLSDPENPFHLVNHAVLMVGWGVTNDDKRIPYWIVKNSWGTSWGENGYFRILRGSDEPGGECAIESLTVAATPVIN